MLALRRYSFGMLLLSTWKRFAVTLFALAGLAACDRSVTTPPDYHLGAPNVLGSVGTRVNIEFRENLVVRLDVQGRLRSNRGTSLAALQAVLDRHSATQVRPLYTLPADRLAARAAAARARSGGRLPDPRSWHWLVLPPGTDVERALVELRARPEVEHAYVAPEAAPLPVTPDFRFDQYNYVGAAPSGTENMYARQLVGGRGAGVQLVDLEYDWNFEHEDLGLSPTILITGERFSTDGANHGTAVLGVLVGRNNGFGITGGAPDATIRVASPFMNGVYQPADAIMHATDQMVAGDVLLLEQQLSDPNGNYVPLEWDINVYRNILDATLAGIVVIEAAGNGGQDLDSPLYGGRWDRELFGNTSGAIIVGAGDDTNARLAFSNYGSRVDVQAHGRGVTTTGYGDLFGSTLNDRYTARFSGTSSASAIVAAAATVIQGYRKHRGWPVLTSDGMANLFRNTGSPQTGTTSENIGPKPNLCAAIGLAGAVQTACRPDLFIASMTHSPAHPISGDVITFDARVHNRGTGPAVASTLDFRIPVPLTRSSFPVRALWAGESFSVKQRVSLSVVLKYRNTATADVAGSVVEFNETNNVGTHDYAVTQADQRNAVNPNGYWIGIPSGLFAIKLAQVVTVGVAGPLVQVRLPVTCPNSTGIPLLVEIQGVASGKPNGIILASQPVSSGSLAGPGVGKDIMFATPRSFQAGDRFAVVLSAVGQYNCRIKSAYVGVDYAGGQGFVNSHGLFGVWSGWRGLANAPYDLAFVTAIWPHPYALAP